MCTRTDALLSCLRLRKDGTAINSATVPSATSCEFNGEECIFFSFHDDLPKKVLQFFEKLKREFTNWMLSCKEHQNGVRRLSLLPFEAHRGLFENYKLVWVWVWGLKLKKYVSVSHVSSILFWSSCVSSILLCSFASQIQMSTRNEGNEHTEKVFSMNCLRDLWSSKGEKRSPGSLHYLDWIYIRKIGFAAVVAPVRTPKTAQEKCRSNDGRRVRPLRFRVPSGGWHQPELFRSVDTLTRQDDLDWGQQLYAFKAFSNALRYTNSRIPRWSATFFLRSQRCLLLLRTHPCSKEQLFSVARFEQQSPNDVWDYPKNLSHERKPNSKSSKNKL